MKDNEFLELRRGDIITIEGSAFDQTLTGIIEVEIVSTFHKSPGMARDQVQVFMRFNGKPRFMFIHKQHIKSKVVVDKPHCPKCDVGIDITDKGELEFRSSHAHYAKKRPYTCKSYGKLKAEGHIMAVFENAADYVPLTAQEIAFMSNVKLKTVRNRLGEMLKNGVVLKGEMCECYITRRMSMTYRMPTHKDTGMKRFDMNKFAARFARLTNSPLAHRMKIIKLK